MTESPVHHCEHHVAPPAQRLYRSEEEDEHVILVAVGVRGRTREAAERALHQVMPRPSSGPHALVECWWIAEDDRHDGSDNDSAIFVPKGSQDQGDAAVRAHGLIP